MKWFFSFSFLILFTVSHAQKISVSLFNELALQTLLITPVSGHYSVITDEESIWSSQIKCVYFKTGDSVDAHMYRTWEHGKGFRLWGLPAMM